MKKQSKFLIGGIVAVLILVGAVFATNTDLFKGSLGSLNEPITRAQMAGLIAKELDSASSGFPIIGCFDDISDLSQTEQAYICFLESKGLLYGISDTTDIGTYTKDFKPQQIVNRAEAAVFLYGTFGDFLPLNVVTSDWKAYSDVSKTDWFFKAVANLGSQGVLDVKTNKNNKFYPNNSLTNGRAQSWMNKIHNKISPASVPEQKPAPASASEQKPAPAQKPAPPATSQKPAPELAPAQKPAPPAPSPAPAR